MKGHSRFLKSPGLEPHHQIQFTILSRMLFGVSYLLEEMQLVFSMAAANWILAQIKYRDWLKNNFLMVRETWVQSQVTSYQRLLKWYLIPPCLTLRNIWYVSRVKWSNQGKGVVPSPHLCVVAIEKGAFWLFSTTVTKFTYLLTKNTYDLFLIKIIVMK